MGNLEFKASTKQLKDELDRVFHKIHVEQLRRRAGEGAAVDSEDWSLRPAGPAHPAEPRHSPVRRGTQDKHGWLGRRQWRLQ